MRVSRGISGGKCSPRVHTPAPSTQLRPRRTSKALRTQDAANTLAALVNYANALQTIRGELIGSNRLGQKNHPPRSAANPTLHFLRLIEPIFSQQRTYFGLDNSAVPTRIVLKVLGWNEETVTNPVTQPQICTIFCDRLIEDGHPHSDQRDDRFGRFRSDDRLSARRLPQQSDTRLRRDGAAAAYRGSPIARIHSQECLYDRRFYTQH